MELARVLGGFYPVTTSFLVSVVTGIGEPAEGARNVPFISLLRKHWLLFEGFL